MHCHGFFSIKKHEFMKWLSVIAPVKSDRRASALRRTGALELLK